MTKRFLYIHWNILKDPNTSTYVINEIQKLHLKMIKKYSGIFTHVLVVLHIDNIHDVVSIHNAKVEFSNIFNNNVEFAIEQNTRSKEILSLEKHFLNKLQYYADNYDEFFYIHNKGLSNICCANLKIWVAAMYYFLFKDIEVTDLHLMNPYSDELMTGAMTYLWPISINGNIKKSSPEASKDSPCTSIIDWHYTGSFFGINPKKYLSYCKSNNIVPRNKIETDTEVHFPLHLPYSCCYENPQILPFKKNVFLKENNPYINIHKLLKNHTTSSNLETIMNLALTD